MPGGSWLVLLRSRAYIKRRSQWIKNEGKQVPGSLLHVSHR